MVWGGQRGTSQVGTIWCCVATNKIYFKVCVYNVPDNLYDRGKKM
jgi:hypothetical protein